MYRIYLFRPLGRDFSFLYFAVSHDIFFYLYKIKK